MNGQIKGSPNIVADADSGRVWERIWEWMFVLCVFSMNDNNKINMKKKKSGRLTTQPNQSVNAGKATSTSEYIIIIYTTTTKSK